MSMSCHICDECHMDNLSYAFNFQLNTHNNVNTLEHIY